LQARQARLRNNLDEIEELAHKGRLSRVILRNQTDLKILPEEPTGTILMSGNLLFLINQHLFIHYNKNCKTKKCKIAYMQNGIIGFYKAKAVL
jgi:hypothetical protein